MEIKNGFPVPYVEPGQLNLKQFCILVELCAMCNEAVDAVSGERTHEITTSQCKLGRHMEKRYSEEFSTALIQRTLKKLSELGLISVTAHSDGTVIKAAHPDENEPVVGIKEDKNGEIH